MKKRLLSLLPYIPIGLIVIMGLAVLRANYVVGTTLSGWDDLHPEYNLEVNISRSLTSVWQEYQGLGLLGGMGHAADLVRQLFLAVVSPFVAVSFQRYLWTGLMLIVGPLGAYFLLKQLFYRTKGLGIEVAALTSGVLYLFNLATLQYFYTPFETFVAFFGFLPWLVYGALKYFQTPKKINLVLLFVISLLSTPAFYVQTLFFVWLIIFAIMAVETLIRFHKTGIKRVVLALLTVIAANAFWLLPVVYFTLTNSHVVELAKGNILSTEDTQLMNQGAGRLRDVALLRGYWFDYTDANTTGTDFSYLLSGWREYISQTHISIVGYAIFVISLIGAFVLALNKRKKISFFVPIIFFIGFFMLTNENGLTGSLFAWITNTIPLFGQIFRSVFTKWSTILSLAIALGGGGLIASFATFKYKKLKVLITSIFAVLLMSLSIFFTKPMLEGKLISDSMKVTLPQVYQELFAYFKTQPKQARIAFLPVQSFWGWNFYDWGYRGSGFLWYGIEQPILDRAFDVWSRENETFYNEISTAVYGKDEQRLAQILKKYDVSYILIDESVTIPAGDDKQLYLKESKELLDKIGAKVSWQKDFISVYEVGNSLDVADSFLYAPKAYQSIEIDTTYSRLDIAYQTELDYISYPSGSGELEFPFGKIFKEKLDNISYSSYLDGSIYAAIAHTRETQKDSTLVIPAIGPGAKFSASAQVFFDGNSVTLNFNNIYEIKAGTTVVSSYKPAEIIMPLATSYEALIVDVAGQKIDLQRGQEKTLHNILVDPYQELKVDIFNGFGIVVPTSEAFSALPVNTCWEKEAGKGEVSSQRLGDTLAITATDAVGCIAFKLGSWEVDSLMDVSLPFKSIGPAKPHFCVTVEGAANCITDDIFYNSEVSPEWSTVDRRLNLKSNTPYWMVVSARPPDEPAAWEIQYNSPNVSVYPKIHSYSFAASLWEQITKGQQFKLQELENLTLNFSTAANNISLAKRGRVAAHNCDLFKRGEVAKSVEGETAIYTATDRGASCDFAIMAGSSTLDQYLLRITGTNKSGRSAKLYLFNQASGRNDIEDLLPKNGFDVSFSLLSWPKYLPSEYILNVETRSFGYEQSVNEISNIAIYQLPLNWVGRWEVQSQSQELPTQSLQLESVKKYGTWLYRAEVSGTGVLALSQGYDKGWINLSGFEHVKLNGWANGWVIDENQEKQNIIIFYWPQLLQFIGFGLLVAGALFALRRKV